MRRRVIQLVFNGFLIGSLCLGFSYGQQRYIDRNGVVVFEASEKLFEPIKAKNESVTAVFDASNNALACLVLIRGFQLDNPLMQEHFNESYMESEQYPKAYFKGILLDFTLENVGRTKQNVMVRGTLNIRGVTKEMETELLIQKVNGIMALHGSFMVRPKDFGIKIPKLVENKIAKTVWVTLNFKLSPADEK